MMDDDDFEDLFAEADLLQDSSQESLTYAAADLDRLDVDTDDALAPLFCPPGTPPTSVTSHSDEDSRAPRIESQDKAVSGSTFPTNAQHEVQTTPKNTTKHVRIRLARTDRVN